MFFLSNKKKKGHYICLLPIQLCSNNHILCGLYKLNTEKHYCVTREKTK